MHALIHPNYHHQITCMKLNLKIHYTPPYKWKIQHHQKANIGHIRRARKEFSWEKSIENKNGKSRCFQYNRKKYTIFNYIPHKTITCDDRDPPWINKNIELILEKNQAY